MRGCPLPSAVFVSQQAGGMCFQAYHPYGNSFLQEKILSMMNSPIKHQQQKEKTAGASLPGASRSHCSFLDKSVSASDSPPYFQNGTLSNLSYE